MSILISILKDDGAVSILRSMDESGALSEMLPELTALKHDGPGHKDNFTHTLQVLQNVIDAGGDIELRLTAVFHDMGKAETKMYVRGKGYTFHNHENVSGNIMRRVFRRLEIPTNDTLFANVYLLVTLHGRPKALTEEGISDSAIRRLITDCGSVSMAHKLIDFLACDTTTSSEAKRKRYADDAAMLHAEIDRINLMDEEAKWRAPINGHRIMELTGINGGSRNSDGSMLLADIIAALKTAIKSGDIPETVEASERFVLDYYMSIAAGPLLGHVRHDDLKQWASVKDSPEEEGYYIVLTGDSNPNFVHTCKPAVHFWYADKKEWSSETKYWLRSVRSD